MDESTLNLLHAAEEAVNRLVDVCQKNGSLYSCNPRSVAQVSRTGKWHLNAIAALRRELLTPKDEQAAK